MTDFDTQCETYVKGIAEQPSDTDFGAQIDFGILKELNQHSDSYSKERSSVSQNEQPEQFKGFAQQLQVLEELCIE